jgi:hypothetical protein
LPGGTAPPDQVTAGPAGSLSSSAMTIASAPVVATLGAAALAVTAAATAVTTAATLGAELLGAATGEASAKEPETEPEGPAGDDNVPEGREAV